MLTGLHSVVIEVGDFEGAVRAHSRLLERTADADRAGRCAVFGLANARLELRRRLPRPAAVAEGAAPAPAVASVAGVSEGVDDGIVRLRFALRVEAGGRFAPGPLASPTVPLELVAESSPGIGDVAVEHGIVGLDHVVIATRNPERTRAFFAEDLGIRLALDRSFPERGLRILFFRLGGVTLELAATLDPKPVPRAVVDGPSDAQRGAPSGTDGGSGDAFHGLAWKVRGLEGTRARLLAEGFALSSIRPGHKAGTRVCRLRAPLYGVPTLLIEHPPRPGEGAPPGW